MILGESSCLATYWVRTYPELFACRVLTGISIGGAAPVIFSLMADFYPGSSRIHVSTLVGIAMSAGIALGQLLAGIMGPTFGWRSPFLVVAIPSLTCGLLMLLTTHEPRRGSQEEEVLNMRRARMKYLAERRLIACCNVAPESLQEDRDSDGCCQGTNAAITGSSSGATGGGSRQMVVTTNITTGDDMAVTTSTIFTPLHSNAHMPSTRSRFSPDRAKNDRDVSIVGTYRQVHFTQRFSPSTVPGREFTVNPQSAGGGATFLQPETTDFHRPCGRGLGGGSEERKDDIEDPDDDGPTTPLYSYQHADVEYPPCSSSSSPPGRERQSPAVSLGSSVDAGIVGIGGTTASIGSASSKGMSPTFSPWRTVFSASGGGGMSPDNGNTGSRITIGPDATPLAAAGTPLHVSIEHGYCPPTHLTPLTGISPQAPPSPSARPETVLAAETTRLSSVQPPQPQIGVSGAGAETG